MYVAHALISGLVVRRQTFIIRLVRYSKLRIWLNCKHALFHGSTLSNLFTFVRWYRYEVSTSRYCGDQILLHATREPIIASFI